ncbi:unnamed protein product, partial [marine sediment metagenome]
EAIALSLYYASMNVVIVGYGNMGKEVEKVLVAREHNIIATVDPMVKDAEYSELTKDILSNADVAIEFSLADAVVDNARLYSEAAVPAVVGTTGWETHRPDVTQIFEKSGAYICGSNFSIGAHIFFALSETAARLIAQLPQYDIFMYEIHHSKKKDSPSGTALAAGNRIISELERKSAIVTERLDRRINEHELHIASVRGGSVPGVHTVMIDSDADTLEIRHTARNRSGFASGAVMASEW